MPKPDMQIRPARPTDIPSILVLEKQASSAAHWPESFYSGIFEAGAGDRVLFVAEEEDLPRGFVVARIISDECELENIVVAEKGRQRGVGSKLIRALMNTARERKVMRIFLEVRQSDASARALYEKCGFAITGRRKSYYSDPTEDAVLYTLAL